MSNITLTNYASSTTMFPNLYNLIKGIVGDLKFPIVGKLDYTEFDDYKNPIVILPNGNSVSSSYFNIRK